MNKIMTFLFFLMCSIGQAFASASSIMPEGLENVYLGMPINKLIETRKNIKSGTTYDYCFSHGPLFCKWYKDPNNPKKLDQSFNRYLFKERYPFLLFDTVWFSCSFTDMDGIVVAGSIYPQGKQRDYEKKRDELIMYVIKKWGKPDQVLVGDEQFTRTGKHDYYALVMNWLKEDVVVNAEIPLTVESYFKSLSLGEKVGVAISNIVGDYPAVKIRMRHTQFGVGRPIILAGSGEVMTGKQAAMLLIPNTYKPRKIVDKGDADKLLKSIGFDELMGRALQK